MQLGAVADDDETFGDFHQSIVLRVPHCDTLELPFEAPALYWP